jgi:hypothetical protein
MRAWSRWVESQRPGWGIPEREATEFDCSQYRLAVQAKMRGRHLLDGFGTQHSRECLPPQAGCRE